MERSDNVGKRTLSVFVMIFFILTAGIVTSGYVYYRNYEKNFRTEVERQLSAIAELKVDELVNWRKERLGDAAVFYKNSAFSALVKRYFENPQDIEAIQYLRSWISHVQSAYQYDYILLLDTKGVERISVSDKPKTAVPYMLQLFPKALRSGKVTFLDFHRDAPDRPIYLSILIPILDGQGSSRAIGLLVLRIDPTKYLYPFISRWPTPSRTAETLLVRRDGDEVVFLNELKFQKNTALNLRFPIKQKKELPAVEAVLGHQGIVEGKDYSGVPVIADVRAVPDSPWFLVARMDKSEVYSPLRERMSLMVFFIGALLIGAGTAVGLVWRHQRVRFYRERYEASEDLLAISSRQEAILSAVPDIIMEVDTNKVYTWSNQSGKEFFGEDVIGKEAAFYFEGEQEIYKTVKPLFNGNENVIYIESWQRRKDGQKRLLAWWCRVLKDKSGNVTGALSTARDITERKLMEEALRENEGKYRTLVENIPQKIFAKDRRSVYMSCNELLGRDLGISSEAIAGKTDYDFFPKELADKYTSDDIRIMESGKTEGIEEQSILLGKEVWIYTIKTPIRDKDGNTIGILGIFSDITERKQMEQEKRKIEEQLLQAQKMEAVGQLAGGVAHDFNNILTAMIGYGHLLKIKLKEEDPLRNYADQILSLSDKAANLTKSLLAFSRKQIIDPRPVDINEIIRRIDHLLSRIIGEDIKLQTVLSEKDLVVMADPGQMEQVLMNLATNARDAMPKGGFLSIGTETVSLDHEYIKEHGFGNEGQYALVSFSDTGAGMDKKTREKIFEPFFTTKEVGKGTGLGLAMVYGIIKQHEGYINVYSEPGRGTTFRIYLPLIEAKAEEIKPETIQTVERGTETVLLAEDRTEVREITKRLLEENGYKVITTSDGQEAINEFIVHKNEIQFVLLDVIMPNKSGREVYEEIKQIKPDIKVLFMSGHPADVIHRHGILEKGFAYIEKPVLPTKLLRKIREVLNE